MQFEGGPFPSVDARTGRGIAAPVVEAAQFLFEIVGVHGSADIKIERRRIDTRRHGPQPALEFSSHDAIEMKNPRRGGGGGRKHDEQAYEQDAPTAPLGAGHAGLGQSRGWKILVTVLLSLMCIYIVYRVRSHDQA
jgi:hypothetical protein